MQYPEYIGAEDYLYKKIEKVLKNKKVYIIIEKFNSKTLAKGLNEYKLKGDNYDYIDIIKLNSTKIDFENDFFEVYISNSKL